MISVPSERVIYLRYDILYGCPHKDDIRFAYEWNGYHIMLAEGKYIIRHPPYIILRLQYLIK